jgi:hypothetical protein
MRSEDRMLQHAYAWHLVSQLNEFTFNFVEVRGCFSFLGCWRLAYAYGSLTNHPISYLLIAWPIVATVYIPHCSVSAPQSLFLPGHGWGCIFHIYSLQTITNIICRLLYLLYMLVFSQLFILLCSWLKVVNIWIKSFDISPMSLLHWWTLSRPFKLYVWRLPKMSAYFRKHRDSIPCQARLGMVFGGWYLKRRWVFFIFLPLAHILSSVRLVYYPIHLRIRACLICFTP